MKYIREIVIIAAVAIAAWAIFFKGEEEPEVIVKKVLVPYEVTVPAQTIVFEPVKLPKPKKVTPRPIKEFKDATDAKKDSLYADAITEREYVEVFKDTAATTTVTSKVQGFLLEQHVRTDIAEQVLEGEKEVEVTIPVEKKNQIYLGASLGIPTEQGNAKGVFSADIYLKSKKDNLYRLGYDTNGNLMVGYAVKIKI